MSYEISPKGRDFCLKIVGIGYQTLSKKEVSYLLDNLATSPRSVDIKGIRLFLHTDEKHDELRSILSSVISPVDKIQNSDDNVIVYPAEYIDGEEPSEFDEEEAE